MARHTRSGHYLEAVDRASCKMCNTELDDRVTPPVCPMCSWRPDEEGGA